MTSESSARGLYDASAIAGVYNRKRRANPDIVLGLLDELPAAPASVLELGCGTGNYGEAIAGAGYRVTAVDLARDMASQAAEVLPGATVEASARHLPFRDRSFDAVFSVLFLHHVRKWEEVLAEASRVLERGPFITFMTTAEQLRAFWLFHYFPEGRVSVLNRRPTLEEMGTALVRAGFPKVRSKLFRYKSDEDAALMSGKRNPAAYLDEDVRAGISMFRRISDKALQEGLEHLRRDIDSGKVYDVIERYRQASDAAYDCTFIIGTHRPR